MAFCDIKTLVRVFFFLKYDDMGIKILVFPSHIQRKKLFYKIMKNSQVGAEKLRKTADFVISLIFSTLMHLDRIFSNIFTNRWLRRIRLCKAVFYTHIDIFLEKF